MMTNVTPFTCISRGIKGIDVINNSHIPRGKVMGSCHAGGEAAVPVTAYGSHDPGLQTEVVEAVNAVHGAGNRAGTEIGVALAKCVSPFTV